MVIVKVQRLNSTGAVGVCIPKESAKNVNLKIGDYVNIVEAGNTLHVSKVTLE